MKEEQENKENKVKQEKIYVMGNWKMNKLPGDVLSFFDKLIPNLRKYINEKTKNGDIKLSTINKLETIIAVPYIDMFYANLYANEEKRIKIAAQDVFYKNEGSYTGEISPMMLKSIDVNTSIVGHSERRAMGETGDITNKKIKALLDENMKVILCIGENAEDFKKENTKKVLKKELDEALKDISDKKEDIIVAYEPIWAIGTGESCGYDIAKDVIKYIKSEMIKKGFLDPKVVYGGSVNSKNSTSYLETGVIDGFLIGTSSLNPNEFLKIYINSAKYLNK